MGYKVNHSTVMHHLVSEVRDLVSSSLCLHYWTQPVCQIWYSSNQIKLPLPQGSWRTNEGQIPRLPHMAHNLPQLFPTSIVDCTNHSQIFSISKWNESPVSWLGFIWKRSMIKMCQLIKDQWSKCANSSKDYCGRKLSLEPQSGFVLFRISPPSPSE